jgi:uncharacterized RDD family membrane protein YckC
MNESDLIKTGFWIRVSAIVLDTIFVYLITSIVVWIGRLFLIYIPFELLFLILAVSYSVLSIGFKSYSLGKLICGLRVVKSEGRTVSLPISFIREFIGKFSIGLFIPILLAWFITKNSINENRKLMFVPLLLIVFINIILLIQYLITKRAWYDYIAKTSVVQYNVKKKLNKYFISITVIICFITTANVLINFLNDYSISKDYSKYSLAAPSYKYLKHSDIIDVATLNSTNDNTYVQWINQNSKPAIDYAVEKAAANQVTFFGEIHEQSDLLVFLQEMIPELYYRANIRCIAMEACTKEDNALIHQLVTSEKYDSTLALEIGRHQPWLTWGFKDYWDVFKAVWKLNNSLSTGLEKMEIIGLDSQWDGPSFALAFGGENGNKTPLLEKLRILRALKSFSKLQFRDELMAKEIEKEIIAKGKKGIVWIGSAHSFINYKQPFTERGRTAYILHQKYGDTIFQIYLHQEYFSAKLIDQNYSVGLQDTKLGKFLDTLISQSKYKQIGFDLVNSPLGNLRDSTVYLFHYQPNVCFADITPGYIFLKPENMYKHCRWVEGFITPEMFAREKPYFESMAGKSFSNANQVNDYYIQSFGK